MNIVYLKEKRDECLSKLERGTSRIYLQEFLSIYNHTKKQNKKQRELLKEFQYAIREIRDWTVDKIKEQHFLFNKHCDVFDNLVRSIFKLHLAIYNSMNESNFDAAIPNPGQYLHETFLSIARRLWKEPYLLYDIKVDKMTYQKNMIRLEKIVRKCLRETFVFMLPFKEFDEKLANEDDEEEEDYEIVQDDDDDEEEDPMSEEEEQNSGRDTEMVSEEEEATGEDEEVEEEVTEATEEDTEPEPEPAPVQEAEHESTPVVEPEPEPEPTPVEEPEQDSTPEPEPEQEPESESREVEDPNIRIIQLPVRRTLAERKRLVKEKVKQRGFPEFSQPRPSDSFF